MKVRVTKKFADFINKMAKAGELHIDCAELKMLTAREYNIHVGETEDAEYYGDYVPEEDRYKVIQITYPPEYYAMPIYITSQELIITARRFDVKTFEALKSMLKQIIEI